MSVLTDDDATLPGDGPNELSLGRREREGWLMPGAPVGRYMVLMRLGAGGMGVVYAAYDPELDRKVALKLLRPGHGTMDDSREREHRELKQEAQALAKLSHPNVIAVHDVGEHEGRVFLAMEFVDGHTLGHWLAEPHDWRETLEVFLRAGEGLRAAHEQGLVHRDFKPDNVMVGHDGRVRVMDFGLARSTEVLASAKGLVGTPAYMAPEQHAGVDVDARSDQFSFCVALWQGLYGARPFGGDTMNELLGNILEGRRLDPALGERGKVPTRIRQALLRGLDADPAKRWPAMEPLLRALARQPERQRWLVLGASGMLLGCAALVVALRPDDAGPRCEAPGAEVAGAWDAERRGAVEQALLATEVSHALPTWTRVEAALDGYAAAWTGTRQALCEHPPQDGLDRERSRCLDRRKRALRSLVDVLAAADATIVDKAVSSIARLPEPERCLDVAYVSAEVEPPEPAAATEVEALQERLARLEALGHAGKATQAAVELEPALAAAAAVGYAPLLGEARLVQARLESAQGHGAQAITAAREAYEQLLAVRHDELAARAALLLVGELGDRAARPDEGLAWLPTARALGHRAELGPRFEAELQLVVGNLELGRGAFDAAVTALERTLALRVELYGPEHVTVSAPMQGLGSVFAQRGDLEQATRYTEQALRVTEQALGPEHPDVGSMLLNLGNLRMARNDLPEARRLYERSLVITEAAYGSEHPELVLVLSNLGSLDEREGDLAAAQRRFERALAIAEAVNGPQHPNVALALTNLSLIALRQGDPPRAERATRRSIAIWEATLGPEPAHPQAAAAVNNLASALVARGSIEAARVEFERACRMWEATLGPDNPALVDPLTGLTEVQLALGRYVEATASAERALGLLQAAGASTGAVAYVRFLQAHAQWGRGIERAAALASVRRVRQDIVSAMAPPSAEDPMNALRLAEIDGWLAKVDPS